MNAMKCDLFQEMVLTVRTLADLGGREGRAPPLAQNFLIFMQFLGKIWIKNKLAPPPGLASPVCGILDPPLPYHRFVLLWVQKLLYLTEKKI